MCSSDLALDEQGDDGVAARRDEIGIGGFDGAEQNLVAHGAAIDEKMDSVCCWAVKGAETGKSDKARIVAGMIERNRIWDEIRTQNLPDASIDAEFEVKG